MTKLKDTIIEINDTKVCVTTEGNHKLSEEDIKCIEKIIKKSIKKHDEEKAKVK